VIGSRKRAVPKARRSTSGILPTAGFAIFHLQGPTRFHGVGREAYASLIKHTQQEDIMHFCMTGQYTPQALNSIMENPKTNRYEAAKKLIEAADGKLISMYSTAADGPGVLVIFDVPDPSAAPAISGTVVASGAIHNVSLTRLWTQDEITLVRQKAVQLRGSYSPPGS
jgi:uncharacterized protein with GYD domain